MAPERSRLPGNVQRFFQRFPLLPGHKVEYVEAVSALYQRHCITGRFADVLLVSKAPAQLQLPMDSCLCDMHP